jgi:hypothetical protein
MEKQYIYILGNTKNPEIIKVGETHKQHPETRAIEITRSAGTIGKWFTQWYIEVPDSLLAEKIAHYKIRDFHIEGNGKEKFEMSAYDAHLILEKFIIHLFEIEKPIIFYSEELKKKIQLEEALVKLEETKKKTAIALAIDKKSEEEKIKIFESEAKKYKAQQFQSKMSTLAQALANSIKQ